MSAAKEGVRIRFTPGLGKYAAIDVKVEHVKELEDGSEHVTDISPYVRAADIRLHVGEVATAKLEVFVSNVQVDAAVSEIATIRVDRGSWWRRKKDLIVTCFDPTGAKHYVKGVRLRASTR